jgi:hypothetical protein
MLLYLLVAVLIVWVLVSMLGIETMTYPSPAELKEVEQVLLPSIVEDDPVFDIFPMVDSDKPRLRWVQKDNWIGLQQIRGLNGAPRQVKLLGANEYDFAPGVYGEFIDLDEAELTDRMQYATFDQPVSIDDLVGDAQEYLLMRRLDRIRYIAWTLLTAGVFSVPNSRGEIIHQDIFPVLTLTAGTPWSTVATATPTINIRAAQQLSVGQSVDFGGGAEIWMNQVTANNLLANTNASDFFGRRVGGGNTVNMLGDINDILAGNNLPTIRVYDRGYIDDSNTFQKLIPNGKAILIGKRLNGAPIGEYRMTRNFVNDMKPGAYTKVVDLRQYGQVPGKIIVHDGHNGGPVIFFPSAIVVLNV